MRKISFLEIDICQVSARFLKLEGVFGETTAKVVTACETERDMNHKIVNLETS